MSSQWIPFRSDLSPEMREALVREADERKSAATSLIVEEFGLDQDQMLRGKRQNFIAGPGDDLSSLHLGLGLKLAERVLGSELPTYATRASLLYYDVDDFALLHQDVTQCSVTILVAIGGKVDPLIVYPYLGSVNEHDVRMFNKASIDDRASFESSSQIGTERLSGVEVDIRPESMVAILGRDMAHARYPQTEPAIVAAMCYSSFLPLPH